MSAEAAGQQVASQSDLTGVELRLDPRLRSAEARLTETLTRLEVQITGFEARMIAELEVLKWMTGCALVLSYAIFLKVLLDT